MSPGCSSEASLRSLFLLDPEVHFLNHGSFGACPRPVFERYQAWQRELESRPVEFLLRRFVDVMRVSREALAEYVGTHANNLVYVPNATTGVNIVAQSLALGPGDEVLATDHEYGACDRAWRIVCERRGATYRRAAIALPATDAQAIADHILSAVSDRTRVLFLSHITSRTALVLPVEDICRRARAAGVLTLIDGAHGPGQVDISLDELGADYYVANCHKWMCSPKGAGFLYARPEAQDLIQPLIVGWGPDGHYASTTPFIDELQYTGTRDISSYLSVPAAIGFQREHGWPGVRERCHRRVRAARSRLLELPGIEPATGSRYPLATQMAAVQIPTVEPVELMTLLYERFRVEVPVLKWGSTTLLRVSVQGYNDDSDIEALLEGVRHWLKA